MVLWTVARQADRLGTASAADVWNGDYEMAARGFGWLAENGRRVPLRHRLRARLGAVGKK